MLLSARAQRLLADVEVVAGIKQAMMDSDMGGATPFEQGGFILEDPRSGELSVARWPPGLGNQIQPVMSFDGTYQGKGIVGSFHTHSNVGPEWRQEPSRSDIRFVQNYPLTAGADHFVVSVETVYHIDGNGNVLAVGKTQEVLK
jgi:hypothetical protein